MKRLKTLGLYIVLALIVFLGIFPIFFNQQQKKRKSTNHFLKHQTMLHLIDEKRFKSKLTNLSPQWMKEQIEEDFQEFFQRKITNAHVDETFSAIKKNYPHPWFIRYRVMNQQLYRYFPDGEPISLEDNAIEKAIKTLMHFTSFKNLDFIISYIDGIPVPEMPSKEFYHTASKDLQAPIFFSAKGKTMPYLVLIPDWRSISDWWSSNFQTILTTMKNYPWEKKKNFALWRGSLTKWIRKTLCELSSRHPENLDAKINIKVDDSALQELLETEGLFGKHVSWEEFLECKYLPVVDGVCCAAPAFQWRLLCNSVTLKQESDEIQWFYRALKPYEHYIPIKNDLSDLMEKIEWAKLNDSFCKKIAARSTEFALNHLMMEDIYLYFFLVMKRYESLMHLNKKKVEEELTNDPYWVNIQDRSDLKRRLKKERVRPFVVQATPY